MRSLRSREAKDPGDRIKNQIRRPHVPALLQTHVIVDAHAGQHGELLAPQSRDATVATDRQTSLLGPNATAARAQKLAELDVSRHERNLPHHPSLARCPFHEDSA